MEKKIGTWRSKGHLGTEQDRKSAEREDTIDLNACSSVLKKIHSNTHTKINVGNQARSRKYNSKQAGHRITKTKKEYSSSIEEFVILPNSGYGNGLRDNTTNFNTLYKTKPKQ